MNTTNSNLVYPPSICFSRPYQITMHDDGSTPLLFVGIVLVKFFNMDVSRLQSLLLTLTTEGVVVCGFYNKEIAEAKVDMANHFSQSFEHKLSCTFEWVNFSE